MSFKAILYAYILGGLTFIPLLLASLVLFTVYTSVPVGELDVSKRQRGNLEAEAQDNQDGSPRESPTATTFSDVNDVPRTRKGWLTMRRTFEESQFDGGYVTLVRSFLDARSKDPKRSRPKDMWYVVLKGKILYLYEDEGMTECEAAIQLGAHDVVIFPEGLQDAELFAKRNAICLKPKPAPGEMPSLTKGMKFEGELESQAEPGTVEKEKVAQAEQQVREEALDTNTPWFIFVRSNIEMEDWYHSLIHASDNPAQTPMLSPLQPVFQPVDMNNLVSTLDEQPDVIPMRWLNALIGRIFYSFYRTCHLENSIIARLMKKLSKVKRPAFLPEVKVTRVSVGDTTPTFSKPMLKELTKEGDASLEVHVLYKGEIRITVEATAKIDIGSFKSYNVKLVLAAVLREIEGNLLIKVKRPPSNRLWYAFTQTPRMVLEVEPIVSDRQITWTMILGTIESKLKEIIQESIVMPNMDDISFFESAGHMHRGGIWADSAREETPQVPETSAEDVVPPGTDAPDDTTSDSEVPVIHKSQPLQERTPTSMSLPEPPTMEPSTSAPPGGESRTSRRRTWFSTVRGDEFKSLPEENDQERGRSVEIEKPESSPRSQSTPGKPESMAETSSSDDGHEHLSPESASRSSSQSSDTSNGTGTKSMKIPEFSAPSSSSLSSKLNPSSSPTSTFLSTLKSKAGDKQALSNSAKEAMRKWGWGGKKDDEKEGMSDQGSVSSDSSSRTRNDSLTHRARSSYAEVRAAVENRRKEEQDTLGLGAQVEDFLAKRVRTTSASSATLSVPDADDEEKVSAPAPIRMQPQAKTMSIPGIHASHKGNVMSMGYVAPSPPPPASPPRNPVYRLWKSTAQEGVAGEEASGEESTEPSSSSHRPVPAPPSPRPVPAPPSPRAPVPVQRPVPPPLPPRNTSAVAVARSPVDTARAVSDTSASESLKSIAERSSISSPTPQITVNGDTDV